MGKLLKQFMPMGNSFEVYIFCVNYTMKTIRFLYLKQYGLHYTPRHTKSKKAYTKLIIFNYSLLKYVLKSVQQETI